MKPYGGEVAPCAADQATPHDELLERVLDLENMRKAWKRVKANKGAAGVDGLSIDAAFGFIRQHWEGIRSSLASGRYKPAAVRRVEIPKPDGSKRPLGIPTVLDRVIQQAIAQVLTPLFDPHFSESSYGFRPGRSAHDAVRQVKKLFRSYYPIAVDADLSKFFDTVNHDPLMRCVAKRVKDERVLKLIRKYLKAEIIADGLSIHPGRGVPQGGPLSPLLANILLDELDKELERRGLKFVRYADDFIIMVKTKQAGERVFSSIRKFLERELLLEVNETKSKVARLDECTFLGFHIIRGKIRWSQKSEKEFKRRIKELTGRSWGVSMQYRLRKLREYMRGWMGYFGISEYYKPIPPLDQWIRRRLRLCYWKMWKRPKMRRRQLRKLGIDERQINMVVSSRKGYWKLSRTLATNMGLGNAWLKEQGLVSLKEQWSRMHYPDSVRR
ncbi:Group II intron-encoded protein LtrA [Pontiella desulfatans]|uniref:Group II intron-encoded protein LtrA n=1 Tax=Pontiella desulfatans TaxID=2750659 RepID=A0A6C2TY27_PONDE|nr:group II intron reverse transcriptase/maturase [Pontiella desulfatans]VGO12344.1 Group II intron-encoded protein LtrA [Pontiella desulfatans]